jgi:hypothetical protein
MHDDIARMQDARVALWITPAPRLYAPTITHPIAATTYILPPASDCSPDALLRAKLPNGPSADGSAAAASHRITAVDTLACSRCADFSKERVIVVLQPRLTYGEAAVQARPSNLG